MLESIGINGLLLSYGFIASIIPLIILGILNGFFAGHGNFKVQDHLKRKNKARTNIAMMLSLIIIMISIWYVEGLILHWLPIVFAILAGVITNILFTSYPDSLIEEDYSYEEEEMFLKIDKSRSLQFIVLALIFAVVTNGFHFHSSTYENILPDDKKTALYFIKKDMKTLDTETGQNIHPGHKLLVCLYNQDNPRAKVEAIKALDSLDDLNIGNYNKQLLYSGSADLLNGHYNKALSSFYTLDSDTLVKLTKVAQLTPIINELVVGEPIRLNNLFMRYLFPEIQKSLTTELPSFPQEEEIRSFRIHSALAVVVGVLVFILISLLSLSITVHALKSDKELKEK